MQAANGRLASVQQRAHQLEADFAEVQQRVQELEAACESKQQQLEVSAQQAARAQEAAAKAEAEVCATLEQSSREQTVGIAQSMHCLATICGLAQAMDLSPPWVSLET